MLEGKINCPEVMWEAIYRVVRDLVYVCDCKRHFVNLGCVVLKL